MCTMLKYDSAEQIVCCEHMGGGVKILYCMYIVTYIHESKRIYDAQV